MTDAALTQCVTCDKPTRLGYACPDCVNGLLQLVAELGDYWAELPDMLERVRGTTGRMSPGYGSRSPGRDDVIVALDPWSRAGDVDEDGEAITRRPDDTGSWMRSIPASIAWIADWIAECRDEPSLSDMWSGSLPYIRLHLRWCAQQPWFDDLADDLTELHHQARTLANDRPQGPLADCLVVTCDGKVYEGGPGKPAKCDQCGRPYAGLDLIRLGAAQESAA